MTSRFPFPIGESQNLSIGSLSLDLDWVDFAGDQDDGIGYQRVEDSSQQTTATESIWGTSLIEGPLFTPKHLFKWDLQLTAEKKYLLKAIYDEQEYRRRKLLDLRVRLKDRRIVFMSRLPRTQAKLGDLILDPSPPSGFTFHWAQFNILLELGSDFDKYFLPTKDGLLYRVTLTARELDVVPITEDE